VASDVATDLGLELAVFSEETTAALEPHVGGANPRNPVDLAGDGEDDIWNFDRLARVLLEAPEVDALVMTGFFGGYGDYNPHAADLEIDVARSIANRAHSTRTPLLVHSMLAISDETATLKALREEGIAVYPRIEQALIALAQTQVRPSEVPAPAPVAEGFVLGDRPSYPEARSLLSECGVAFPDGHLARSENEAAQFAAGIGGSVVLKAIAADLVHKSDVGGVIVGVDPAEVAVSVREMKERISTQAQLELEGIWVEGLAPPGGVDLVVGARRDPSFGPVVLVGVGGIFVEILDDVVLVPVPVDRERLLEEVRTLRAWPLLEGVRGGDPVDVAGAVAIAARLGDLLLSRPEVSEVEINPLRVYPDHVLALDARVIVTESSD
jgi:acyl-CoA synthetase (NDP forming)